MAKVNSSEFLTPSARVESKVNALIKDLTAATKRIAKLEELLTKAKAICVNKELLKQKAQKEKEHEDREKAKQENRKKLEEDANEMNIKDCPSGFFLAETCNVHRGSSGSDSMLDEVEKAREHYAGVYEVLIVQGAYTEGYKYMEPEGVHLNFSGFRVFVKPLPPDKIGLQPVDSNGQRVSFNGEGGFRVESSTTH